VKLIRFGETGGERPGVLLDDGSRLDVSDFVSDYDEAFFTRGGMDALRGWLKTHFSSAPHVHPQYVWARRFVAPARSFVSDSTTVIMRQRPGRDSEGAGHFFQSDNVLSRT